MQPTLSSQAILRRHGSFGFPTIVTADLYPQKLVITKGSEKVLYDIPLQSIQQIKKAALGGVLYLKTSEYNISVTLVKSAWSALLFGPLINGFRNNDKSKQWEDMINQNMSNAQ